MLERIPLTPGRGQRRRGDPRDRHRARRRAAAAGVLVPQPVAATRATPRTCAARTSSTTSTTGGAACSPISSCAASHRRPSRGSCGRAALARALAIAPPRRYLGAAHAAKRRGL
jgi:hypothetical protein